MEFIGFAGKKSEINIDSIVLMAESIGLSVIRDNWSYDNEISSGLRHFLDVFQDDCLVQLVLEEKDQSRSTYSNLLTEELSDFHIHGSNSRFIDLLQKLILSNLVVPKMHIIFASEWERANEFIRFYKCDLAEIEPYFQHNNGWHLIYYSLKSKSYVYDFSTPLIFEVKLNC